MLHRLREVLAEVLYPPFCVSCKAGGEWWCESCREKTEVIAGDVCPACFALIHESPCDKASSLDGIVPVGFYHDPQLRAVIWSLKYQGGLCILPSLRTFLGTWRSARQAPWPWAGHSSIVISAVPTSARRARERGFDQAEIFANLVREEIVPWATTIKLLSRTRDIPPQAGIEVGPMRAANIQGAFQILNRGSLPEQVILVDDVAISGATLMEAARTLKQAGVLRVYAIVLAIGK